MDSKSPGPAGLMVFDRPNLQNFQAAIAREARIGKAETRNIVLEKCVILSSVSSAERQPAEKTSQDKDLRVDDIADDNADDILMADDKTKNIVSHQTAEQQRVSRLADDTDDKNPQSTSSDRPLRFKIGDLVRLAQSHQQHPLDN
jgi:hypothetical protein